MAVIESTWKNTHRASVKMAKQLYETFTGNEITDDLLVGAAKLFSENYGIWGEKSGRPGM